MLKFGVVIVLSLYHQSASDFNIDSCLFFLPAKTGAFLIFFNKFGGEFQDVKIEVIFSHQHHKLFRQESAGYGEDLYQF